jgi:DMSO/TMAO reductase YedYZ heme-binding membrane subunit
MNLQKSFIRVILLVSIFCVLASLVLFGTIGINETSVRFLIRWTSKLSALFFSLAFAASGLHLLFKSDFTKKLIQFRPHLGLSFAVFHSFHLLFLIVLQYEIHPVFTLAKTSSLIGGGLAYVFMYLMAITTFPSIRKRLSQKQWKYLHLVGGYWIWIIFARTYGKKVFMWEEGYFLFGVLLIVFMIRLYGIFKNKMALA